LVAGVCVGYSTDLLVAFFMFCLKDSQNVNNLLNATGIFAEGAAPTGPIESRPPTANLLNASTYKSMATPQKRLSVSPIISTYSFYNKLNLNSPLAGYQQTQATTTTTTTTVTTTAAMGIATNTASTKSNQFNTQIKNKYNLTDA